MTANQGGNYTLTAFKNGYVFTPANQTFNNLQANQTANFQNGGLHCVPAPSGLAAWYKGENNGIDSSDNGNTGTLDGELGFASGKVGQAFSFDGSDDRLRVSDNPNSAPTGALTIDVWAKPAVTNSQRFLVFKYDNSLDNGRSNYLNTDATGAKIQFTVYETPGTANTRRIETTAAVVTANFFTHVAETIDTATQTAHIYINGVDTPFIIIDNGIISSINRGSAAFRLGEFINGAGDHVFLF